MALDTPYGGLGGFGILPPELLAAMGQNPDMWGPALDRAGLPAPSQQMTPGALSVGQGLGDYLGAGLAGAATGAGVGNPSMFGVGAPMGQAMGVGPAPGVDPGLFGLGTILGQQLGLGQPPAAATPAAAAGAPAPAAGWQTTVTPEGGTPAAAGVPSAGVPKGTTPQVAKPTPPQEPPRLVAQNAPQVGKAPGNPLMDLLLSTLLSGARPGLGGGR